jgi:sulfite exporter TauE/SafE
MTGILLAVGENARDLTALAGLAAALGIGHTLAGPDHYVPFLAMSRAGRWTYARTMAVAGLCGVGHVLSSILLGGIGLLIGLAVGGLEWVEGIRGEVAGWLLLGFGLAYTAWGVRSAIRNRPHTHHHHHPDGTRHNHIHTHHGEHTHVHAEGRKVVTPWLLFLIFVFGPCEPLVPLLMYPAAAHGAWAALWVAFVFGACTLATMLLVVTAGYFGLRMVRLPWLERYGHVLAGLSLVACGLAIRFGL